VSARHGLAFDLTRLLNLPEFSGSFTLRTVTEGAYNPVTDSFASEASSSFAASGAMVDYSLADLKDGAILERDKRLIIDASTVSAEPQPGMVVIAGTSGGNYSIIRVREIAPGGTVLAYDCQVRQ
jgi:hypothetical protein